MIIIFSCFSNFKIKKVCYKIRYTLVYQIIQTTFVVKGIKSNLPAVPETVTINLRPNALYNDLNSVSFNLYLFANLSGNHVNYSNLKFKIICKIPKVETVGCF